MSSDILPGLEQPKFARSPGAKFLCTRTRMAPSPNTVRSPIRSTFYQCQSLRMKTSHCSLPNRLSKEACLMCRKVPMRIGQFCGRLCSDNAENSAPRVLEIPEGHVTFQSGEYMTVLLFDSHSYHLISDQLPTNSRRRGKPRSRVPLCGGSTRSS